jgi:hypothetical protein
MIEGLRNFIHQASLPLSAAVVENHATMANRQWRFGGDDRFFEKAVFLAAGPVRAN